MTKAEARRIIEGMGLPEARAAEMDVENDPAGETVLNALWNASFGEPLTEDQLVVLKAIADEGSRHQ